MAAQIKVNDLVKIDGRLIGRVESVIQPLGTFHVYNVRTQTEGVKQIPRHRLQVIPETVTRSPGSESYFDLPQNVMEEILKDDFFEETGVEQETSAGDNDRFLEVDDDDIDTFLANQENNNTARKNKYDISILTSFMEQKLGEFREVYNIPPFELNTVLCKFFIGVRKANGDEYEPNSLRGMLSSIDRFLRKSNYGVSLLKDINFSKTRDVLKSKQKFLKKKGKGNLPQRAEAINDDEVEQLWSSGQLADSNPQSIINTLWWVNTVHFGMRSGLPHRNMKWGDVKVKQDANNCEYLEYNERQTKTRTGENTRDVRSVPPRVWANVDDPTRCPVRIFKRYRSLRPADFSSHDSPFYLATCCKTTPRSGQVWFKRMAIGKNTLGSVMTQMAKHANISGCKRLTNHSARKHLLQKLVNANVPPTHIMQISGHKNVQSINNYSSVSDEQHSSMSGLISNRQGSRPYLPVQTPNPNTEPPSPYHYPLPCTSQSMTSVNASSTSEIVHSLFSGPIHGGVFNINFNCVRPNNCSMNKVDVNHTTPSVEISAASVPISQ